MLEGLAIYSSEDEATTAEAYALGWKSEYVESIMYDAFLITFR